MATHLIICSMSHINYNAPWHPLKHVWVGASYAPEFYETIRNSQIRDCLQKIASETEEDYQNLVKILENLNIQVDRPEINADLTIIDYINQQGQITYGTSKSHTLIPRPPMQPRDSMLIVGNVMIESNPELRYFDSLLSKLNIPDSCMRRHADKKFDAPMITVVGQHLIVDCREQPWLADHVQSICPDRQILPVMIGGHNDAVFCPVRPGLIISTYHHTNYENTFPGWTVKHVENQSWNSIPGWRSIKHANINKWWLPGEEHNVEFANFVDTWLSHWLGFVAETVFDVNMLQIDENTILVNNYNKEIFDFFKMHHIKPIIAPFRHRFFWDGGIHCITNDIYRQGDCDVFITR